MMMWSTFGVRERIWSSAGTKSSATVQQMQPLASSTMFSSGQVSTPQLLQDLAVDADIAELVDDQRQAFALGVLEEMADQRRLAGAEEAGDDGAGNAGERSGHAISLSMVEGRDARDEAALERIGAAAPGDQPVGRSGEELCAGDRGPGRCRWRGRRRHSSSSRRAGSRRRGGACSCRGIRLCGRALRRRPRPWCSGRESRPRADGRRSRSRRGRSRRRRPSPPTDRRAQWRLPLEGKCRRPSNTRSLPGTPAGRSDQSSRRQVSWLAGPSPCRLPGLVQWLSARARRLQLRGQPRSWVKSPHRIPS